MSIHGDHKYDGYEIHDIYTGTTNSLDNYPGSVILRIQPGASGSTPDIDIIPQLQYVELDQ